MDMCKILPHSGTELSLLAMDHVLPRTPGSVRTSLPDNQPVQYCAIRHFFTPPFPQESPTRVPGSASPKYHPFFFSVNKTCVKVQGSFYAQEKAAHTPCFHFSGGKHGDFVLPDHKPQGSGGIFHLPQVSSTPQCCVGWDGGVREAVPHLLPSHPSLN